MDVGEGVRSMRVRRSVTVRGAGSHSAMEEGAMRVPWMFVPGGTLPVVSSEEVL